MNPIERLQALPRTRLAFLPTPLIELPRLSQRLGGPRIWMKRDDQTGLGLGGNKVRKLEYLVGEARVQGCDTLITSGAIQSNHCRQTAAAAAATGLGCVLALGGEEPTGAPTGNLLLDRLFGATIRWCGEDRKGERVPAVVEELRLAGRRLYVIPYGGSDDVGAMGFVAAMGELQAQLKEQSLAKVTIVVASSSGGTQAGMVVGTDLFGVSVRVVGIGIDKGEAGTGPYEARLAELAGRLADRLGMPTRYTADRFDVRTGYLGGGYGVIGDLERRAIQLAAQTEGILLDPVYTGRAMGGLVDLIKDGAFKGDETILFWHTGGAPALFGRGEELAA
ncbi:MAG: D-cysteine desulfhydrase family protein [Candidatus Bipolaricaulis sp.]|nr:D-cysteine desulfhydrase family protein [Candidatus Bipolaricaulis sp.]